MKNGDFVSDCLAYALFHGQNRINEGGEGNHWIPFTESEVDAKDTFASHFMTDFMAGKIRSETKKEDDLFGNAPENTALVPTAPMVFSTEAKAVFDAGRALWRYYHAQPGANPNAAFYDIREFFQGRDSRGRMNADSSDETYTALIAALRTALKTLAKRIEPKVYEYGFLRR